MFASRSQELIAQLKERTDDTSLILNACHEFGASRPENAGSYSEAEEQLGRVDAKTFFLARVLNELEKATHFVRTSYGYLNDAEAQEQDLLLSAIFVQQNLFLRRSFEALLYCILFGSTNQNEAYEHFLRLQDLDQTLYKNADKREFFGRVSEIETDREQRYRSKVLDLEQTFPACKTSWYAKSHTKRLVEGGNNLVSARSLYKQVQPLITVELKTAIGTSYEVIFGSTSKLIHFLPSRIYSFGKESFELVDSYFAIQSLMAHAIIKEICKLAGDAGGSCCQLISRTQEIKDPRVLKVLARQFTPDLEEGDFVSANYSLCRVLNSYQSSYGMVSYQLEPLEDGLMTKADWIPAVNVTEFLKHTDARAKDVQHVKRLWRELRAATL